ncbi:phage holin family protein [Luteimonas vadosa]|uniref:Phage holin family protein n=1 Tax=Luteimonas vadosa TaxID=1165507 RepID=A0ABP9DTB7_9GAMM
MDDHDPGEGRDRQHDGKQRRPNLLDAADALFDAAGSTWTAGSDALKALRILLLADVSLARSAFGRTLAMTGVAIAAGASAWLLLMTALIVFLVRQLGVPWSAALLGCAALSGAIAAWAVWRADRYFDDTRMRASRRQLARLGIGELAGTLPDTNSNASSEAAAEQVKEAGEDRPPAKKDLGVDLTPP